MSADTELEDGHGLRSSMRTTLRWARRTGAVLVAAGIGVVGAALALRFDAALSVGLGLAGLGAGLPAAVAGCKAWQAQAEAREPAP